MNKPQTLQELRAFFEGIPDDKWCVKKRGLLNTDIHCAFGHMVAAFMDAYDLCKTLGINAGELMMFNDTHWNGPKAGVLEYIDKHISD